MSEPLEVPEFINKLFVEVKPSPEKTDEQRIFELECQVSMLYDFVNQLVEELQGLEINVSSKLNDITDGE